MLSLNIVRSLSRLSVTPGRLTVYFLSVRWGPEAEKKSRSDLIQSVFLWTQFRETQIHIHRMFALKEPPDPDLSESSMITCMIASKRCIEIVESVKDVMTDPIHSFLLLVSLKSGRATLILNNFFVARRSLCLRRRYSFSWCFGRSGEWITVLQSSRPLRMRWG